MKHYIKCCTTAQRHLHNQTGMAAAVRFHDVYLFIMHTDCYIVLVFVHQQKPNDVNNCENLANHNPSRGQHDLDPFAHALRETTGTIIAAFGLTLQPFFCEQNIAKVFKVWQFRSNIYSTS